MWISILIALAAILNIGSPAKAAESPATVRPAVQPSVQQWKLDGIELGDKASHVKGAWGYPFKVTEDKLPGCKVWKYREGKNVGICEGVVSYVQVTVKAGTAVINDKPVRMEKSNLKKALGKPEFLADDGWGIVKGEEALKVFIDKRGKLLSLDLFSGPCGV